MILVKKSDNSYRPCVDFRNINKVTINDKYPLPKISDLLQSLNGAKYFSTLDLESGYWQAEIAEEDRCKTAFTTDSGHYEFEVLCFGLKNAPSIFSRLMNIVLAGLLGNQMLVYMDDIIIFSSTIEEHCTKLEKLLERLGEANLTIKLKKCKFLEKSIKFLGHEVSEKGISVHTDHFLPIETFPVPKNRKDVEKFIGLTSYFRSYVRNFATIAEPITKLLRKNIKFCWNNTEQEAFEKLKNEIVNAGTLIYPDFNDEFFIQVDASGYAIGAVLCQSRNNVILPIFFASKTLSKWESNYGTTKREALAINFGLQKFRHIIQGYKVTLYTDHKSLTYLFKNSIPDGQLGRWALQAQEFDLAVKYLKGEQNIVADSLSRIKQNESKEETDDFPTEFVGTMFNSEEVNWTTEQLKKEQRKDPKIKKIIEILSGKRKETLKKVLIQNYVLHDEILFFRKSVLRCDINEIVLTIVVPAGIDITIIKNIHASKSNGHLAFERTLHKVNSNFLIEKAYSKVKSIIKSCELCQKYNGVKHSMVPIRKYPLPSKPFERVAMDFLGPLKTTNNNNRYILVVTDYLTRFSVMYALPDRTADQVTKSIKSFIALHDVPAVIISDNAAEFVGNLLKNLCISHNINKIEVSPFHPQSNGLVERINAKIIRIMKIFCAEQETMDWDLFLDDICATINSSLNSTVGDTPHFALFHFDRRDLFTGKTFVNDDVFYSYDDYHRSIEYKGFLIRQYIKNHMDLQINAFIEKANKGRKVRQLNVGDRVYIKNIPRPDESKKLAMKWKGPCIIVEKLSTTKFKCRTNNGKIFTVHADNILSRSDILLESDKSEKIINDESSSLKKKLSLNREDNIITRSKSKIMNQNASEY